MQGEKKLQLPKEAFEKRDDRGKRGCADYRRLELISRQQTSSPLPGWGGWVFAAVFRQVPHIRRSCPRVQASYVKGTI